MGIPHNSNIMRKKCKILHRSYSPFKNLYKLLIQSNVCLKIVIYKNKWCVFFPRVIPSWSWGLCLFFNINHIRMFIPNFYICRDSQIDGLIVGSHRSDIRSFLLIKLVDREFLFGNCNLYILNGGVINF
jgi:hypothetical protein